MISRTYPFVMKDLILVSVLFINSKGKLVKLMNLKTTWSENYEASLGKLQENAKAKLLCASVESNFCII